jgi:pyruvate dehydrogenase E2 component (dihydrolipoamide acetyltransferase)|tara:strand:+ start:1610 stop:2890 length:1281 start_codon:yes stop_codon:yes gene_type:complete
MSDKKILVPNIGDFKDVEVIEVLVSEGQSISKNDPLITIENDKSSVEIPSTENGLVKSINLKIGDKVSERSLILTLSTIEKKRETKITETQKEEKKIEKVQTTKEKKIPSVSNVQTLKTSPSSGKVSASPKIRKFARELGVDITQIAGSERQGRIVQQDVKSFVFSKMNNQEIVSEKSNVKKIKNEYEHSDFGAVEIKDIPRIKRIAAPHLVNSWTTIPHVTHHDEADITELEEFRVSLKDMITGEKKKITPLAFIVKALVSSLKKFPLFNSSIDDIENGKITLKKYFHIGIAVDTPHGLMVPKIRNVDKKDLNSIGEDLKEVSEQSRNLRIDKKEFFGGSMTITSLGGIGGTYFTPIINYPEVAILGVGRSYKKQVFIEGKFKNRAVLPLSLSYDHRIIDGAEAAKFCNSLKENLGKNFAYKLTF